MPSGLPLRKALNNPLFPLTAFLWHFLGIFVNLLSSLRKNLSLAHGFPLALVIHLQAGTLMFPPWVASRAGQVWALVCCCIADMGCAFQGLGWEAQGGVLLLVPLSAVAQPCISPLNWGTFVNLQQNSRTCPETSWPYLPLQQATRSACSTPSCPFRGLQLSAALRPHPSGSGSVAEVVTAVLAHDLPSWFPW